MSSPGASDPKYSRIERERRWLVEPARLPPLGDGRLIEDRYLDGTELRLRAVDGAAWKLGKKYGGVGLSDRPIVSVYLSEAEFLVLRALPAAVLAKRRFDVVVEGLRYAVDRFEGPLAGLWLAELELLDAAALAAVTPPVWCGAEVTADRRYAGGMLARDGRPIP